MNILILGAAGFIGTNLAYGFADNPKDRITLVDMKKEYFDSARFENYDNIHLAESSICINTDFEKLFQECDVIFHLVSTTAPATSNKQISQEIEDNVVMSAKLLDACVKSDVKKVVFISSGGTVYGKETQCPLKEDTVTKPISSYGLQKITIENLLYLYQYMHGLDYRIIRLANPYGPYQRPNGILGVVTTFVYKALRNEEIIVYGDGTVVRDFIYIDDAIRAIRQVVLGESKYQTFNIGSGYGTSIKEVLLVIEKVLSKKLKIIYRAGRNADVSVNFLDISRYEKCYCSLTPLSLEEGIRKTVTFMREYYSI